MAEQLLPGMDSLTALCLQAKSANPFDILEQLMSQPSCRMHGPEHHVLVGASLLTAYHNAGGQLDLPQALAEMIRRGSQVPGGVCGQWGGCGAGLSTGMFVSIVTGAAPLAKEAWRLSNRMTALALCRISEHGGPRCCKRDSCLAVQAAADFSAAHLGVQMETSDVTCTRSHLNPHCLGPACPFHPA